MSIGDWAAREMADQQTIAELRRKLALALKVVEAARRANECCACDIIKDIDAALREFDAQGEEAKP